MDEDQNNQPDPHDIIRTNFNTENPEEVAAEIKRLYIRKRIGLKANFTRCYNTLARILSGAMYGRIKPEDPGPIDTSRGTRDEIEDAYQKIKTAYEKLSKLHERVLELTVVDKDVPIVQAEVQKIDKDYDKIVVSYTGLKNKIRDTQNTIQAHRHTTTSARMWY